MSSRFLLSRAAWLVVLALAGCASGKSSLFSEANRLCEDARLIRDVSEAPADVGRELDKRPARLVRARSFSERPHN